MRQTHGVVVCTDREENKIKMDAEPHSTGRGRLRRSFRRMIGKRETTGLENNTAPAQLTFTSNDFQGPKRKGSIKKWLTNPLKLGTNRPEQPCRTRAFQDQSFPEDEEDKAGSTAVNRQTKTEEETLKEPQTSTSSTTEPTSIPDKLPEEETEGEVEAVALPPPMELQPQLTEQMASTSLQDGDEPKVTEEAVTENKTENGNPEEKPGQSIECKEEKPKEDAITPEPVADDPEETSASSKETEPVDQAEKEAEAAEAKKKAALDKRNYILMETVETEKDYVKDLGKVVEGYMEEMKDSESRPPDLEDGKVKMVFGNIARIYEFHRDTFQHEIYKCEEDPERLALLFKRFERRLSMYVVYCQNKPKSEYIVNEYESFFEELRVKLSHKLSLSDLLIKPVQRIMKYQLLLKDFLKQTMKAGIDTAALETAVRIMCVVPKQANDMMAVSRLQGWDGKINAQGPLLRQGTLSVSESVSAPKWKERRIFLFEQIIILSEPLEKKKGFSNPGYIFKNSMKVNEMQLVDDGEPLRFKLNKKGKGEELLLQAENDAEKESWVNELESLLQQQQNFLKALQSPIAYQNKQMGLDSGLDSLGLGLATPPSLPKQVGVGGTKLRKANSQNEGTSPLQKQHVQFSSLKNNRRKNQTAPAAISLSELKDKEKGKRQKDAKGGTKGTTTPKTVTEKEELPNSPSFKRKFLDGLFHSFRPSKSRDTSPQGSKENLHRIGKDSPREHHGSMSQRSSPTTAMSKELGEAGAGEKNPLMRTQSAHGGSLPVEDSHVRTGSPSRDSGVPLLTKRASTGSIQKDPLLDVIRPPPVAGGDPTRTTNGTPESLLQHQCRLGSETDEAAFVS